MRPVGIRPEIDSHTLPDAGFRARERAAPALLSFFRGSSVPPRALHLALVLSLAAALRSPRQPPVSSRAGLTPGVFAPGDCLRCRQLSAVLRHWLEGARLSGGELWLFVLPGN